MDSLVDIALLTYNQEKYISEAIESVLMQQTKFRFRLIIGEDCSTDSTPEICRRYADQHPGQILLVNDEKNVGLVQNYDRIFKLCTAKYTAILEGDDYWTDKLKLQKQVDILEEDNETGLVHTDYDKLFKNGRVIRSLRKVKGVKPPEGWVFNALIKENFITAATVCFRKELFDRFVDFKEFIRRDLVTIDYPVWIELSYHSKIRYIDSSTAVFRVVETSLTNNKDFSRKELYYNKGRDIKKYYISKYSPENHSAEDVDRIYDKGLFYWAVRLNDQEKALEYFNRIEKKDKALIFTGLCIRNRLFFRLLNFYTDARSKVGMLVNYLS